MASVLSGLEVNWLGGLSKILYWVGYILFTSLIFGLGIFVYYVTSFKYKVTIMKRGGTGKDEDHSINKIVKDRGKEIMVKGVRKFRLLKSRKKIQPIDYKHIYPGNNVFLYQSGAEAYHPVKLSCSNPDAKFEQIPSDVSFWMGLSLKEVATDYDKQDFWSKYGNVTVMAGTVLFCLILTGLTVYYSYQHANGVTSALGGLTNAISNTKVVAPY